MEGGKVPNFFSFLEKITFRVIFAQNQMSEQKLCVFSELYFFSDFSNLSGFWNLDQLIHFSGKLFKNRLGKIKKPSE